MSLHLTLKEATRHLHEDAEHLLFPDQPWKQLSLNDYRQFLRIQYAFHYRMEHAIEPVLSPSLKARLRWPLRQKRSWISNELLELRSNPLPPSRLSSLTSEAEALGFLYVTEGSTLGGRMIRKALLNNPFIAPYTSFRFLEGYGADTGTFWKEFLEILAHTVCKQEEKTVVEAAKRGFSIFAKCVRFVQQEMPA